MLEIVKAAAVIKRAMKKMRRRKWVRSFARIDPEVAEAVSRRESGEIVIKEAMHLPFLEALLRKTDPQP